MFVFLLLLTAASINRLVVHGDTYTVGYITGSKRRNGDSFYEKPGRTISGAISLAAQEINAPNGTFGSIGHRLEFVVAETYGEEETSILQVANLWKQNVSAYIGPQETCFHEGRMAAAFNLPMISYFCTDHSTSDKNLFPTFARTRPPDTQISKSVASVLSHFNWTHVVFLYLNSTNNEFGKVAATILATLKSTQINVEIVRTWSEEYHHTYFVNPFYEILRETYQDTRIYVILGHYYEHLGLMVAMKDMKLLENGDYFVVGVDIEQYDPEHPAKYFKGLFQDKVDPLIDMSFQSYISVKPSSTDFRYYIKFSKSVNYYLEKPPFNFPNPWNMYGVKLEIQPEAAYLYDAVHIYAHAVVNVLNAGGNPMNGTVILNAIKGCRYKSAMGFMVYMDMNGDAEGNYTLLARLPFNHSSDVVNTTFGNSTNRYGLFPVGIFSLKSNDTQLPILKLKHEIPWVNKRPPVAVLPCGFRGEKCIFHYFSFLWLLTSIYCLVITIMHNEKSATKNPYFVWSIVTISLMVIFDFYSCLWMRRFIVKARKERNETVPKLSLEAQNLLSVTEGEDESLYVDLIIPILDLFALLGLTLESSTMIFAWIQIRQILLVVIFVQAFFDHFKHVYLSNRFRDFVCRLFFLSIYNIAHSSEIIWGVIGGILSVLLITSLVLYRNWRYEQELDSLLWKIDFKEIEVHDENSPISSTLPASGSNEKNANGTNESIINPPNIIVSSHGGGSANMNTSSTSPSGKMTRAYHPLIRTSQVSLSSNPDADFRYSSIFTKIGIYKGRIYAIKRVHKKSIDITREMKKELKIMRDLRHNNLNAFIGACTDPPNICIITEYCSRGSLKDILENEEVKLDNMFVASIVADILRGMIYLHDSPVRFHGALCTANCLVDSRWVVKVADFGLHEFKRGADESQKYANEPSQPHAKYESLLYRAPELLRSCRTRSVGGTSETETGNGSTENYRQMLSPKGTQKGDVYSFSIILYELHSRHGPFGETGLTPPEIIQRVIAPSGSAPYRPNLESLENSFDFVTDCLKDCWAELPENRPDFKTVRTKLRPLRKGMKSNIFDNMMAMMEKYANNLEVLVDERTDQLQEEKKKTEALLLEMLPRPVAEQLKRGHKVEAESYDCVTIYFSDIVGFTSMSAESTPLQVVDFLNDLYTCFDSIIENYDVYKVETIGDAYMVVSGLPIRNGDQHAAEIATMSLHLLSAVTQFTIRHRPNEKLMLRIGIHSGPVCAGVVGLKMPRYCLFGDTVNTTSRMESTGQPLKIHCSQECKNLLDKLGGYMITERGLVEMKGKGEKMTYWLSGEDEIKRAERLEARNARRSLSGKQARQTSATTLNRKYKESNGIIPRSSMKHRSTIFRNPLPRCSSLESPKRLRFASGDRLELFQHKQQLDIISDSPIKKSSGSLIVNSNDCCSEALRTSSSSCPCIENITNSTATLEQSQLYPLPKDNDSKFCLSVPMLFDENETDAIGSQRRRRDKKYECSDYSVTVSVPNTPPRRNISALAFNSQYLALPFVNSEFLNCSTPLLNAETKRDPPI